MYRHLELCLRALDAIWCWRFDERAHQALRPCHAHRRRNGVDRGQGENGSVVVIERCLVLTMVIQQAVRGHVAVHHKLGVTMIFALVHVLRRGHRQQADGQAQHARDNPRHPHT